MSDVHDRSGHPDRVRLAALLDEPEGDERAAAHLRGCDRCRAEFEGLSRMRMALSGLGELDPPVGGWHRLEEDLEERGLLDTGAAGGESRSRPLPNRRVEGGGFGAPLRRPAIQAAAALLLFAGGILAGRQLTEGPISPPGTSSPGGAVALGEGGSGDGGPAGSPAGGGTEPADLELADVDPAFPDLEPAFADLEPVFAEFERLGAVGFAGGTDLLDPASAAERLARLDALIGASREAVSESPADPVANALLFRLVEQRDEVASRLNRSVHLTGLEYR